VVPHTDFFTPILIDVLADREIAQDLLIDVLGKQQGALLVAGGTKAPSAATIGQ